MKEPNIIKVTTSNLMIDNYIILEMRKKFSCSKVVIRVRICENKSLIFSSQLITCELNVSHRLTLNQPCRR